VSLSAIPRATRKRVFDRDGGRCQYCHLLQVGQAAVFHINHVIPKSKGGPTDETNLALQCPYCSLHKSAKVEAVDPSSGEAVLLFHPLRQKWSEHFALDAGGICSGLSAVGRATVDALQMNDPLPRIARAIQITLGLLASST
jgi:hypothetical protein